MILVKCQSPHRKMTTEPQRFLSTLTTKPTKMFISIDRTEIESNWPCDEGENVVESCVFYIPAIKSFIRLS